MTPRSMRAAVIATVALVTLASVTLLSRTWSSPPTVNGSSATVGDVTAQLQDAEWVELGHDHGQGGFAMADEMMPGAPRGDEVRLGISLSLVNTGSRTQRFSTVDEFRIVGGGLDEARGPAADTIGGLNRLGPYAGVDGTLYFDVEIPTGDDPPLLLQWTRDREVVQIPLPAATDPPVHEHG